MSDSDPMVEEDKITKATGGNLGQLKTMMAMKAKIKFRDFGPPQADSGISHYFASQKKERLWQSVDFR